VTAGFLWCDRSATAVEALDFTYWCYVRIKAWLSLRSSVADWESVASIPIFFKISAQVTGNG